MAESFPDAENAFRDAFNLQDPTPKLLEIIRAHPEMPTIIDLLIIYLELIEKSPTQIDKLTGALVNIKNSHEISVAGYDRLGNPEQIQIVHALRNELEVLLRSDLAAVEDASVTPSNEYLITSLISAAVVKHQLCNSAAFHNAVARGLNYRAETSIDPQTHEVLVLGACLLLSISGSYLYGPKLIDGSHILGALEKIEEAGLLEHPDGQRLLEATIRQAKDGFKSDIDGWGILFPSSNSWSERLVNHTYVICYSLYHWCIR